MATQPTKLAPPAQDRPMLDSGQHTQSWAQFHQSVADRLADADEQLAALQAQVDANIGVTDGSNAAAGQIGEYLEATINAAPIADNTQVDLGSLSLTAGDWQVSGTARIPSATLGLTIMQVWVSTVSATPVDPYRTQISIAGGTTAVFGTGLRLVTMPRRMSLTATTTVYLGAYVKNAGAGSSTIEGFMSARRVR
jgi:hypothetical protein